MVRALPEIEGAYARRIRLHLPVVGDAIELADPMYGIER
jgi:hypothetical protein